MHAFIQQASVSSHFLRKKAFRIFLKSPHGYYKYVYKTSRQTDTVEQHNKTLLSYYVTYYMDHTKVDRGIFCNFLCTFRIPLKEIIATINTFVISCLRNLQLKTPYKSKSFKYTLYFQTVIIPQVCLRINNKFDAINPILHCSILLSRRHCQFSISQIINDK